MQKHLVNLFKYILESPIRRNKRIWALPKGKLKGACAFNAGFKARAQMRICTFSAVFLCLNRTKNLLF